MEVKYSFIKKLFFMDVLGHFMGINSLFNLIMTIFTI